MINAYLRLDNLIVSCLKYRLVFKYWENERCIYWNQCQKSHSKDFVVFDSLEDGKDFVSH